MCNSASNCSVSYTEYLMSVKARNEISFFPRLWCTSLMTKYNLVCSELIFCASRQLLSHLGDPSTDVLHEPEMPNSFLTSNIRATISMLVLEVCVELQAQKKIAFEQLYFAIVRKS